MDAFEAHRPHLHAVATRILGSRAEADDALQEAWIRIDRADTSEVDNIGGWLTTVVSRVCLSMLDARKRRREDALEAGRLPDPIVTLADDTAPDPEGEALAADAVGAALLVVLETLQPAERLAFVLHDMFAVPFEDIAPTSTDRRPRHGSWRRGRGAASGARTATRRARTGRSSTRSWPPPAAATSRVCSRCWTRTSSCAPTTAAARSGWSRALGQLRPARS